jgi:hypothetical protein
MKALLVVAAIGLTAMVASAGTFTGLIVNGDTNIYTAGGNADPATCCNGGGGSVAVLAATFAAGANQVLTLSDVSGRVGCALNPLFDTGPDGPCFPTLASPTNITALNSLSGIDSGSLASNMFLVGVFLNSNAPSGAPPASLSYPTAASYTQNSYAPLLNQVFFIGDGLTGTGSGAVQQFLVPTGATRLYLGFADSFNFSGAPGYYGDNTGNLRVSGSIDAIPEPATWTLAGLGLGAAAWLRRRRA